MWYCRRMTPTGANASGVSSSVADVGTPCSDRGSKVLISTVQVLYLELMHEMCRSIEDRQSAGCSAECRYML